MVFNFSAFLKIYLAYITWLVGASGLGFSFDARDAGTGRRAGRQAGVARISEKKESIRSRSDEDVLHANPAYDFRYRV